jgi:SAM-dependent methyltransferase
MMESLRRRLRFVWRYLRGNTPWDSGIVPPEIVKWVETHPSPPGRALDLGCGTGTTSRYLAQHGWDTVGIDFAPNAVARARRATHGQNYTGSVMFMNADVSRPDLLPNLAPFDLAVDVGCLHSLTAEQRAGYAANLIRLLRPGATYLLYAFKPVDHWQERGIDPDRLRALFGVAFEIVDYVPGEEITVPRPSAWYTLRRVESRV